jgi:hypothetical protein
MIKELTDLPPGVLGFETSGKLQADDYRDVLAPAITKAAENGELRVVIVIPEFDGMAAGAVWQDMKMGVDHLRGWRRIALVTDIDWMVHATALFGWMTPGEVKTFALADKAAAITWAAG